MGRYLFRGKRVDSGEWITGDLSRLPEGMYLFTPNQTFFGNMDNYKVDPATVCQCTGLVDKNGVAIYEGDIYGLCYGHIFVVKWVNEDGRFLGFSVDRDRDNDRKVMYVGCDPKVEVIGNRFDNPELLEAPHATAQT